jgi:hypothetical protein
MQPLRVEHVAASLRDADASLGETRLPEANGHSNGNGKGRRAKAPAAVVPVMTEEPLPEMLVEAGGK